MAAPGFITGKFTGSHVSALCGALSALVAVAGLLGIALQIPALASLAPGYKTLSMFAAICWIALGAVLFFHAIGPLTGIARTGAAGVCAAVAFAGAIEFPLNLIGTHSFIDILAVQAGDWLIARPTTHISPLVGGLAIPLAIAVFVLLYSSGDRGKNARALSAVGITGLCVFLIGFTIMLSYGYGSPLLYGTAIAPTSYISALAACCMGLGLVTAAGTDAYPLRYFTGTSTRACLLRTFIPVTLVIIFIQDFLILTLADVYGINDSLLLAASLVLFCLFTSYIVARTSRGLGNALDLAEGGLQKKNDELQATYEQLSASEEELRQQYEELAERDRLLRESESRYHEIAGLLERSSQPFAVGYPDGRLKLHNEAFSRLTGYSSEELQSIDWADVLTSPEWRGHEREALEELHRTGTPVRYEKEYTRKDGTRVPVELFVHLIRDSEGKPFQYYSFITDISERKKAEENLQKNERRFRALVRNSFDIIRILDASGHITYESPSSVTILGYPEGTLIGKSPLDLIHPDDLPG